MTTNNFGSHDAKEAGRCRRIFFFFLQLSPKVSSSVEPNVILADVGKRRFTMTDGGRQSATAVGRPFLPGKVVQLNQSLIAHNEMFLEKRGNGSRGTLAASVQTRTQQTHTHTHSRGSLSGSAVAVAMLLESDTHASVIGSAIDRLEYMG